MRLSACGGGSVYVKRFDMHRSSRGLEDQKLKRRAEQ